LHALTIEPTSTDRWTRRPLEANAAAGRAAEHRPRCRAAHDATRASRRPAAADERRL